MTNEHPITPPPELVEQWRNGGPSYVMANNAYEHHIAAQAARWGADQELEECCEWVQWWDDLTAACQLRNARRPKPPSRKEQALEAISRLCASVIHDDLKNDAAIVRRALEALDD